MVHAGNQYTCVCGDDCLGKQCEVDFSRFSINADVKIFLDTCVVAFSVPNTPAPTSALFDLTPAPTPALSDPSQPQLFTFSAQFEAAWGLLFDPESGSSCSGSAPTVRLTCRYGDIKFVNSTYETVTCTDLSRGVMECTDSNSANFVDQFSGVVYVRVGPQKYAGR